MTFVSNFLDFSIKKVSFDVLNHLFEVLPIFETSSQSINVKRMATFFSLLLLGVFGSSQFLGVFHSSLVNNYPKLINYTFQFFLIPNVKHVQVLEIQNDFFDKDSFLVAFRRDQKF